MESAIVSHLEELCGAPLPAEYLRLIESYPSPLRKAARADSGDDSEGFVHDFELFSSMKTVLEINHEVRAAAILDPDGQEFLWPDQLLVIGETGDGDYYCVDLDREHEGILQFRHHAVEFETVAESLEEYIDLLIESFVTGSDSDEDLEDLESDQNG